MKQTILALVILASVSLSSFAATEISLQQKKDKKDFPKELNLSKDQEKKMEEINKDFGQKIEAVKNSRITEEAQQEKIKALRDEKKDAMGKILTAEQKAQFEKRQPRSDKEKGQPRRDGNDRSERFDKRGGGMFADLDLTDAQKEEMEKLREKFADENKTSFDEQREAMLKILTPEQQAKLKEKRESFSENRKNRTKDMEKFNKLDDASKAKYKELKETYMKERSAVERSRIAPDMQKQKLDILKENFDKEAQKLLDASK